MRRAPLRSTVALGCAVLILASCASTSTDTSESTAVGATLADREFVAAMLPHHDLGLRLLEIGTRRADDVRVRRLMFEMNSYHADDHTRLSRWSFEWGVASIADFPGKIAEPELIALSQLTGATFDRTWLRLMIDHHRGAVAITRNTITASHNDDVTELAQRILTVQRDEIAAMERLTDALSEK